MVLLLEWEAFSLEAQAMFQASGGRARLLLKYRHKEGQLVLKVTSGATSIKFKTGEKDDIRYVEKLQQWFLTEAVDPAKVPASAEHTAAGGGGAASSSAGVGKSRGGAAAPSGDGRRAASALTGSSKVSSAARRRAHRIAVKEGRKKPTPVETHRALRKAAQRTRKLERREERLMLAAAGKGPALDAIVPATLGR